MGPFQLMIAQNKTKTLETSRGPQGYCNYLVAAPGAASVDDCTKQNKDPRNIKRPPRLLQLSNGSPWGRFNWCLHKTKQRPFQTARHPQGFCNYLMAAHGAASIDVCTKQRPFQTARGPQGFRNYLMAAHGAAKVEKILLGDGWSLFFCLNQRGSSLFQFGKGRFIKETLGPGQHQK